MREIKFRAWDKKVHRMLGPWTIQEISGMSDGGFIQYAWHGITEIDDLVFRVYTGLRDKNGKEIYEGDIVNNGPLAPPWVEWLEEGAGFIFREVGSDEWWSPNGFSLVTEFAWEIIGNIYENPELLETK